MELLQALATSLLSPMVLAFALGIVAKLIRSDLKISDEFYTALTIYLLFAIGLKGGMKLESAGLAVVWKPILAALFLSVCTPIWSYVLLRKSEAADAQQRFGTVLYTTLEAVRIAALLVQPVMPTSAAKLLDLLGQPAAQRDFRAVGNRLTPGTALPEPAGVFPRYQAE